MFSLYDNLGSCCKASNYHFYHFQSEVLASFSSTWYARTGRGTDISIHCLMIELFDKVKKVEISIEDLTIGSH